MAVRTEVNHKYVKVIYSNTIYRNPPVIEVWEFNCNQCGKLFEMYRQPNPRDKRRYCSPQCCNKAGYKRYKEKHEHNRA